MKKHRDFSPEKWIFSRALVGLVNLSILGLLLLGCEDPMILMNDSERGMWRAQNGIPDKEASLLQVKNLSRDLEGCAQRRGYAALSDQQIKQISMRNNQEIYKELAESRPLYKGIVSHLFEKLEQAYETGNRRKKIYQAIRDGQADESLKRKEENSI